MPMEEDLLARLIGGPAGDNVDWFDRPDALPAVTLNLAAPGREWTHDGPDGLDEPRVRAECWAGTKAGVAALKRWLLATMEQAVMVGTTRFHPAALELERWDRPDDLAGGVAVFRVTMDFTFYHEEVAP